MIAVIGTVLFGLALAVGIVLAGYALPIPKSRIETELEKLNAELDAMEAIHEDNDDSVASRVFPIIKRRAGEEE